MSFIVIGINHRTAPVAIREQVVFADADLPSALTALGRVPDICESLIVSTCNRTAIYCFTAADPDDNSPTPSRQLVSARRR